MELLKPRFQRIELPVDLGCDVGFDQVREKTAWKACLNEHKALRDTIALQYQVGRMDAIGNMMNCREAGGFAPEKGGRFRTRCDLHDVLRRHVVSKHEDDMRLRCQLLQNVQSRQPCWRKYWPRR
jgi:hypothetical protein